VDVDLHGTVVRVSTCGNTGTRRRGLRRCGLPARPRLQRRRLRPADAHSPVVTGGVRSRSLYRSRRRAAPALHDRPVRQPINDTCATPIASSATARTRGIRRATRRASKARPSGLPLLRFDGHLNDGWPTRTAPSTGTDVAIFRADLDWSCVGAGVLPHAPRLRASTTFCGLQSAVCLSAAGQTYTIQIGAYAPPATRPADFTPSLFRHGRIRSTTHQREPDPPRRRRHARQLGQPAIGSPTTVSGIEASFGSENLTPAPYVPSGPVTVVVWDDPNDGNPADCVLLARPRRRSPPARSTRTSADDPARLQRHRERPHSSAPRCSTANEFPAPVDMGSSTCSGASGNSWFVALGPVGGPRGPHQQQRSAPDAGQHRRPANWLMRLICGPSPSARPTALVTAPARPARAATAVRRATAAPTR
jgi:hypothetical protein